MVLHRPGRDHPRRRRFDAEPIAAWWTINPYSNENVRSRTFVLAPTVEVLALDPADRPGRASNHHREPADAALDWPRPCQRWAPRRRAIAVLTYSPTGQVTRMRLTRGC